MAIAASAGHPPRPRPARAAGQRPGALRRAGRRLLRRRLRALRPRRADPDLPAARRRHARQPGEPQRQPGSDRRPRRLAAPAPLEGIARQAYDGTAAARDARPTCRQAQVTTRDIDRGAYPHFLLKEITEAPDELPQDPARQARGARRSDAGRARRRPCSPPRCAQGLRDGRIGRVQVIGQGTAHVAGQSLASALVATHPRRAPPGRGPPRHRALGLRAACRHARHPRHRHQPVGHDHRHEPHRRPRARSRRLGAGHREPPRLRPHRQGRRRAVHLRRPRRGDERRVHEGLLRPDRRRASCWPGPSPRRSAAPSTPTLVAALRDLPSAMEATAARRAEIAVAAQQLAPSKRYWAIVGNGTNRIAAEELRIKLSELCYRSIACDATEDKKHIDLSCEPLILVCAAGLEGSTADDVAKEVAIYRAHKASPIVIAIGRSGPLRRRPPRDLGPGDAPSARLRADRRGRATCSATRPRSPSTPRPARCGRLGPPSRRRSASTRSPTATGCCGRCSRTSRPRRPASSTGCAAAPTTATSRPARRYGWRPVVPLRARHRPARRLPGRARPHRHARRGGR